MGDHDAMMQSHSVIELYKIHTGCSNLIFSQSIFLTNKNKSTSITEKIGDIKIPKLFFLTLSTLGGAGPSIVWGGVNLTRTFYHLPGAYWAIILSILIIILFKERINDYLEKKIKSIS